MNAAIWYMNDYWHKHPATHVIVMAIKERDVARFVYGEHQLSAFYHEFYNAVHTLLPAQAMLIKKAEEFILLLPPVQQTQVTSLLFEIDDLCAALARLRLHKDVYMSFGITLANTTPALMKAISFAQTARIKDDDYSRHATSYNYYTPTFHLYLQKQYAMHQLLDTALIEEAFRIVIQPKINSRTSCLLGGEVLVRWFHQGKEIPLSEFLPLAQETTSIRDIDLLIAKRICTQLAQWQKDHFLLCPISINVSKASFLDGAYYLHQLHRLCLRSAVSPALIELELCEDIPFHRHAVVEQFLSTAQAYGFACSLDDFGSSQASLQAISLYSFSCVKLDQCFFHPFDEKQRQILRHSIALLQDIQQPVIAEGVETLEQVLFLQECGCDAIQGYYYDAPLAISQFQSKYLKKEKPLPKEEEHLK